MGGLRLFHNESKKFEVAVGGGGVTFYVLYSLDEIVQGGYWPSWLSSSCKISPRTA
jgi:hypothetical protein